MPFFQLLDSRSSPSDCVRWNCMYSQNAFSASGEMNPHGSILSSVVSLVAPVSNLRIFPILILRENKLFNVFQLQDVNFSHQLIPRRNLLIQRRHITGDEDSQHPRHLSNEDKRCALSLVPLFHDAKTFTSPSLLVICVLFRSPSSDHVEQRLLSWCPRVVLLLLYHVKPLLPVAL